MAKRLVHKALVSEVEADVSLGVKAGLVKMIFILYQRLLRTEAREKELRVLQNI